jgi:hypothetical protein
MHISPFVSRLTVACTIVCAAVTLAYGYEFKGQASITLYAPLNDTMAARIRKKVENQIDYEIHSYLQQRKNIVIDTTNPVERYHLDTFLAKCRSEAKQNSYYVQRDWNYSLALDNTTVETLLQRHNARCDSLSRAYFRGLTAPSNAQMYVQWYKTLCAGAFYAKGCFYDTTTVTYHDNKEVLNTHLDSLTSFFSHITFDLSSPVITGKTGFPPEKAPECTILYDSLPLPGFPYKLSTPGFAVMCAGSSDYAGSFTLAPCKIPYVNSGTFVYLNSAPERVLDKRFFFTEQAFGIDRDICPNAQLVLKISSARYALNYQAVSASEVIIPEKFKSGSYIHTFLEDSCNLVPAQGNESPDIRFEITCQTTKYSSDETETTALSIKSRIIVAPLKQTNGSMVKVDTLLNHHTYDYFSESLNTGEFFWDAAAELKNNIHAILARL